MPTADVLATVKWDTLTHQYKLSLIQLFNKGYFEMFPHALAEQFIVHSNRSASRTKHGLIAQRFASNYVKNSIAYRGTVLWNAISRSNGSILDCTDMKSFLKKVVKCYAFSDLNSVLGRRLKGKGKGETPNAKREGRARREGGRKRRFPPSFLARPSRFSRA